MALVWVPTDLPLVSSVCMVLEPHKQLRWEPAGETGTGLMLLQKPGDALR